MNPFCKEVNSFCKAFVVQCESVSLLLHFICSGLLAYGTLLLPGYALVSCLAGWPGTFLYSQGTAHEWKQGIKSGMTWEKAGTRLQIESTSRTKEEEDTRSYLEATTPVCLLSSLKLLLLTLLSCRCIKDSVKLQSSGESNVAINPPYHAGSSCWLCQCSD